MICPKCNLEHDSRMKFCRKCGTVLVESQNIIYDSPADPLAVKMPDASKTCRQCNMSNPSSAKFCRNCGGSLSIVDASPQNSAAASLVDKVQETAIQAEEKEEETQELQNQTEPVQEIKEPETTTTTSTTDPKKLPGSKSIKAAIAAAVALLLIGAIWGAKAYKLHKSERTIGERDISQASSTSKFPSPKGYVSDFAGVLKQSEADELSGFLKDLKASTSAEVAVVTVPDIDGYTDINEYTKKLFNAWGIGKKELDNGVLVVVAVKERKTRIEVGTGLEREIPDRIAASILRDSMIPYFKSGEYGKGLMVCANQIAFQIKSAPAAGSGVSAATVAPAPNSGIQKSTYQPSTAKPVITNQKISSEEIRSLLNKYKEANLRKDADLLSSCYSPSFPGLKDILSTFKTAWSAMDYVKMRYNIQDLKAEGSSVRVKVRWTASVIPVGLTQPNTQKFTTNFVLSKEPSGVKFERSF